MTDQIETNGGAKQFNRRFRTGCVALGLITVAFYACMFKMMTLDWFTEYAKVVTFIAGGVILGITVTDGITNFRGGTK